MHFPSLQYLISAYITSNIDVFPCSLVPMVLKLDMAARNVDAAQDQ